MELKKNKNLRRKKKKLRKVTELSEILMKSSDIKYGF